MWHLFLLAGSSHSCLNHPSTTAGASRTTCPPSSSHRCSTQEENPPLDGPNAPPGTHSGTQVFLGTPNQSSRHRNGSHKGKTTGILLPRRWNKDHRHKSFHSSIGKPNIPVNTGKPDLDAQGGLKGWNPAGFFWMPDKLEKWGRYHVASACSQQRGRPKGLFCLVVLHF